MKNDKLKHLIGGYILGVATYISQKWGWGLLISTLLFVGKEYSDTFDIDFMGYKHKATGFDKADLFVDYLGFGLGFGSAGFIHGLINLFK